MRHLNKIHETNGDQIKEQDVPLAKDSHIGKIHWDLETYKKS